MKIKKKLRKVYERLRLLDHGNQIIDAWDKANEKRAKENAEKKNIKEKEINKSYV